MRVEELLTGRDHVLLAFDGPVAVLPPIQSPAARLRTMVAEAPMPPAVVDTGDPFAVIAHAAAIGPATGRAVYAQLCRIEYERVADARVTPGVREALAVLAAAGTQTTVVSGMDVAPVRTFLVLHDLAGHVRNLVARTGPHDAKLPPAPDLVVRAVRERAVPVGSCLFVGTTDADLIAARAAGVDVLRHDIRPPAGGPDDWFAALPSPAGG